MSNQAAGTAGSTRRAAPRRPAARFALVPILLLCGASAQAEEWFDLYTRGLDALKQKQGVRAVLLLEGAVKQRPEPGTNLITYGTNRIEKYYPYLRLADAYVLVGDLAAAREALKRSSLRGKEPAAERDAITATLDGLEKARAAAAAPVPTPAPTTAPPPAKAVEAPPATPVIPTAMPPAAMPPAAPPTAVPPPGLATPMPGPSAAPATAAPAPAPAVPAAIATGTLDLRSDPPGATVLLGNRLLGVTPLRIELPAGVHQITLRKEGSAESSFPVQIRPGAPTLTTRELIATAPAASTPAAPTPEGSSLVVYSQPAGAAVYLDDELLGTTAPGSGRLVRSGVSAGPHRLRLVLEGHDDALHELNVDAAGPTTVRASLAPSTRRSRTIALVLAGLFVLGGVGYALWQRRGKPEPQRAKPSLQPTTVEPPTLAPPTIGSSPTPTPLPTAAPIENQETRAATRVSASGERFGEYRLLEQLGRGGMAMVFKAERNGELCALKRPLGGFIDDPEFRERFLREAEIGRTLHHPNIIRIFERGEVSGTPYFTMELIEGETLQARVRRDGALGPREATRVIAQVAEALDYAHLKGVVHRDLKPSNIMLLRDGVVKVMDYGIARARRFEGLTVTGAFLGTPDYVAPETAEGKGTDARSDLYSLGIVYYEILTARKPFVGNTPFDTLKKHCTEPPTPPSALAPGTPAQIEAIILRLLRKNPEERYPGAEELLIELRDYLNRAA